MVACSSYRSSAKGPVQTYDMRALRYVQLLQFKQSFLQNLQLSLHQRHS